MWKLTKYLKNYWGPTIIGPILKLIEAGFELIVPVVVAGIIDNGIDKSDSGYIWKMGIVLALLCVFGFGFSLTCQYCAAKSAGGFGTNLRRALYAHINKLSYAEIDKVGVASLITRLTADVDQAQQAINRFIRLVTRSPFIFLGSIIMAATISPKLSLILLGVSAVVALCMFLIIKKTFPYYERTQKKLDDVALLTGENISGTRVVRAFSAQKEEVEGFSRAAESLSKTSKTAARIAALTNPLSYGLINAGIILLLYFGGKSVYYGDLSQGNVVALINYMTQILLSLTVLANLIVIFAKAGASAKRINSVLAIEPTVTDPASAYPSAQVTVPAGAGDLASGNKEDGADASCDETAAFENVGFAYGDNVIRSMDDISFVLKKGETLGVIGPTGSGKTTLINLLQRFYDPAEGTVRICGKDIKSYTFGELRKTIGLVAQRSVLFSGTLRENMQWANEQATDEDIARALKIAQAEDFVSRLKAGYDSEVLKGGKNFSGGQRQRLCIARALVGNPRILILDDAYSALDFITESKLRRALRKHQGDMTVVIISQRTSSLKYADQILVLENGKNIGLGSHDELLESCELYREIHYSQSQEDEQ